MDRQRPQSGVPVGSSIGRYEVLGLLGAGGMGEVYRARDPSLGREVAIKVLPADVGSDPARLARFRREARLLAALSHPNVGAIFGLEEDGGDPFLVLELVPGDTLADRLRRGPLSVRDAVDTARQVAAALEAAHARGILHRDLKPSNVKRDAKGRTRVLDFGLATAYEGPDSAPSGELSRSPTVTGPLTGEGAVLGTAPYMSPEQVRGQETDPRTDLWALGCLLFELLTGRAPFARASQADTLAAVLGEDPEWSALPAAAPGPLQWFLRRCLEKDADERWHHAADARIVLEEIAAGGAPAAAGRDEWPSGFRPRALAASALGGVALGVLALWSLWPDQAAAPAPPRVGFSFRLPPGYNLEAPFSAQEAFELAPDGSFVVFSARPPGGGPRVYRRSLDSTEIEAVPGTEGGRRPFVSPDGRWIGFFTEEGGLAKVPVEGGLPQRVFDAERLMPVGASWGPGDRIFFPRGFTGGIGVVSASGRGFEALTRPDYEAGEVGHWSPQAVLDGHKLLFGAMTVEGRRSQVLDLDDGELRRIEPTGAFVRYVDTGHVAWLDGQRLLAAPFDLESGRLVGEATTMLSGVTRFDVSSSGTLVYTRGPTGRSDGVATRWSVAGKRETALPGAERGEQLRISPDGRRIALYSGPDLWVVELDRGVRSRFTTHGPVNNFPVWSPDGTQLLFNSIRDPHGLYVRSADGVGEARLVLERDGQTVALPASWAPDGRGVAVTELDPDGGADVALVDLDSPGLRPLVAGEALEHSPAFSPDGRWLAWVSDESGRDEVYVAPYPDAGPRVTISTQGGTDPRWSRDGRSLLFRRGSTIYEVEVDLARAAHEGLEPSTPRPLAELPSFLGSLLPFAPSWDVAPNGDLVYLRVTSELTDPVELFVVVGWAQGLPSPGDS